MRKLTLVLVSFLACSSAFALGPRDQSYKSQAWEASYLIRAGKYTDALVVSNQMLSLNPKNLLALTDRATCYFGLKQNYRALQDCNQAIAYDPSFSSAYKLRALINLSLKRYAEVIADDTELVEQGAATGHTYYERALAYRALGMFHLSRSDREKAVQLHYEPNSHKLFIADSVLASGNVRDAIGRYTGEIMLHPNNPKAYERRAAAYYQTGCALPAANDYSKAIALGGANPENYVRLAIALSVLQRYAEAIKVASKAIELSDAATAEAAYDARAMAECNCSDYVHACDDWTSALKARPTESHLHLCRAQTLLRMGHLADALADVDFVLQSQPNNLRARLMRAEICLARGQTELALKEANACLAVDSEDPEFLSVRAKIYLSQQRFNDAMTDTNLAIKQSPITACHQYALRAEIHDAMGDHVQANADRQSAVRVEQRLREYMRHTALSSSETSTK